MEFTEKSNQPSKKKSLIRRIIKFFLYFVGCVILLCILLYFVLSMTIVQDKITTIASSEVSKLLNTHVKIGAVRYKLFSSVSLQNIYIADKNNDTLAYAKSIDVGIKPLRYLLDKQIVIDGAEIRNLYLNAYAKDSISEYNYQFLVDEFSSSDTTKSEKSAVDLQVENFRLVNARVAYRELDRIDTLSIFNPSDIYITDLNAKLEVNSIDPSALDIKINQFSGKDHSGATISNIEGTIKSTGNKYFVEGLKIQTPDSYLEPEELSYDTELGLFRINLEKGELSPADFIAFMPHLEYLNEKIYPKIVANGILPSVQISSLKLRYGDADLLEALGFISTYEDLEDAIFELDVKKLSITPEQIAVFGKLGDPMFEMPELLNNLKDIAVEAKLNGRLDDFTLKADVRSMPGSLGIDLRGAIDTSFTIFNIKTELVTNGFNLKSLLGNSEIGKLSAKVNIELTQKDPDQLFTNISGNIQHLGIMKGTISNLPFSAYMTPVKYGLKANKTFSFGTLKTDFEITKDDYPDINLDIHVDNFRIAHFYAHESWNNPILDFDLKGAINGFNIDDLNAAIDLTNFRIRDTHFDYKPGSIQLRAWKNPDKVQNITLKSTIADLVLKGKYSFSTLSDELSGVFNPYFPTLFPKAPRWMKYKNNFDVSMSIYNTESLSAILDLPFVIDKTLKLNSEVNTMDQKISFSAKLPSLSVDSTIFIKDTSLAINTENTLLISLNSKIKAMDTKYDLGIAMSAFNDSLATNIDLKSDSSNMNLDGNLQFATYLFKNREGKFAININVFPTIIKLKDFIINLLPASIKNEGEKIYIDNLGLGLNGQKYFNMDGVISSSQTDTLHINFTKAQINEILTGFNMNDIYAEIDGNVKVINAMQQPEIFTDNFLIKDIVLYGDTVGSILTKSIWENISKTIRISSIMSRADRQAINLRGNVNPSTTEMDLTLSVDKFDIGWLEPFLKEYLSSLQGSLSSELSIKGPLSNLKTSGFLGFNDSKFGIQYTNTTYYISDTIRISPEYIGLRNLELRDSDGDVAMVNANVSHNDFKNLKFNLGMQAKNLMVLNTITRTDSLFYGKIFASGNINITGTPKGVNMKMNLQNAKKSNLNITIPQVSEATDYKNIVFINVPDEKKDKIKHVTNTQNFPMNMNIGLTVDPNIKFTIVIDPTTNDRLEVRGNGSIDFQYNMENELMSVFGDYTMTEGIVKLNLQNLYNIEFKIQDGSKLNFIGDPMKTKFNIVAYKRVKADLKTLDPSFAYNYSSTRVTVDCLLGISGDINKMDLSYNIQLVDATDDQETLFNSLINTSEAKIRQFAYLVTVGSFYPSGNGSGTNFADGMWTSIASSALSAGLNAVLGSVLGENWNISADISDSSKSVNASTNLLNNRLIISANVGYQNNTVSANQEQFIGDFDVEYILSALWSLKAYSHMNNQFERQGTTIQGLGITYTKDASTLKGLFESTKSRKRRNWEASKLREGRVRVNALVDSLRSDSTRRGSVLLDSITKIRALEKPVSER